MCVAAIIGRVAEKSGIWGYILVIKSAQKMVWFQKKISLIFFHNREGGGGSGPYTEFSIIFLYFFNPSLSRYFFGISQEKAKIAKYGSNIGKFIFLLTQKYAFTWPYWPWNPPKVANFSQFLKKVSNIRKIYEKLIQHPQGYKLFLTTWEVK